MIMCRLDDYVSFLKVVYSIQAMHVLVLTSQVSSANKNLNTSQTLMHSQHDAIT